jgi:hypothetical protein
MAEGGRIADRALIVEQRLYRRLPLNSAPLSGLHASLQNARNIERLLNNHNN